MRSGSSSSRWPPSVIWSDHHCTMLSIVDDCYAAGGGSWQLSTDYHHHPSDQLFEYSQLEEKESAPLSLWPLRCTVHFLSCVYWWWSLSFYVSDYCSLYVWRNGGNWLSFLLLNKSSTPFFCCCSLSEDNLAALCLTLQRRERIHNGSEERHYSAVYVDYSFSQSYLLSDWDLLQCSPEFLHQQQQQLFVRHSILLFTLTCRCLVSVFHFFTTATSTTANYNRQWQQQQHYLLPVVPN